MLKKIILRVTVTTVKKTPAQLYFRTITAAPPVTEAIHWRSMSYGRVCLSQLGDIETADSID